MVVKKILLDYGFKQLWLTYQFFFEWAVNCWPYALPICNTGYEISVRRNQEMTLSLLFILTSFRQIFTSPTPQVFMHPPTEM